MNWATIRILPLTVLLLSLVACHEQPHTQSVTFPTTTVPQGWIDTHYFDFDPFTTYRLSLQSYSGDADLTVYDALGNEVVFSEEYGAGIDEVMFTAEDVEYEIEIYAFQAAEYRLIIEEVPDSAAGVFTDVDGVEFILDGELFSGNIYNVLASKTIKASHQNDYLMISSLESARWLDVVPRGTLYNKQVDFDIYILQIHNPSLHNYDVIRVRSEDHAGKISVFKDVDIYLKLIMFN